MAINRPIASLSRPDEAVASSGNFTTSASTAASSPPPRELHREIGELRRELARKDRRHQHTIDVYEELLAEKERRLAELRDDTDTRSSVATLLDRIARR